MAKSGFSENEVGDSFLDTVLRFELQRIVVDQEARKISIQLGVFTDLALCGLCLTAASALVNRPVWETGIVPLLHPAKQLLILLALLFAWHLALVSSGASGTYRVANGKKQILMIARATALAALCMFIWLCVVGVPSPIVWYPLAQVVLCFWIFAFCGLILARVVMRLSAEVFRRRARHLRNFVVIGTNRRAVAVADNLLLDSRPGYCLAGFVDDRWHFESAPEKYKAALLGGPGDLGTFLSTLALDEVIIALPVASFYQLTQQVIELCREQGIVVRFEASLFDSQGDRLEGGENAQRLITILAPNRSELSLAAKRLVDLSVSATAICMSLPLLAIIALAIRVTSPGPILFSQERVGMGKRRFRVYKFRTMVVDAEALMIQLEHLNQQQGPIFKLKDDPRVTRIGAFLRKTSLDELPQLFNVFAGDTSLVGPRPLSVRDYLRFSHDWHRRRFSVKPGITCLWQVNGRNSVGFDRWMELDMEYIDGWSHWLDFKILISTIPAVLRGSGAM